MSDERIGILSVDEHPVFSEAASAIIGSETEVVVGRAANAAGAIVPFRRHRSDTPLTDPRLPGTKGTDALIASRRAIVARAHRCSTSSSADKGETP